MTTETMRKLRTIAIQAFAKIHANRMKPHNPLKWPEKGYNAAGERDWLECPISFLFDKLDEEVAEIKGASIDNEPTPDVLKEAGDVTALAMMIADHTCFDRDEPLYMLQAPKVICLCGSTKFKDEFMQSNFELTMQGAIVLSVGFFAHTDKEKHTLTDKEKLDLDELHKRKIDLADEIYVVNVDGYIGSSTRSEIEYAQATGKPVRYRYQDPHQV